MSKLVIMITIVLLNSINGFAVDDVTVLWEKQPVIPEGQKITSIALRFDNNKNQIVLLSNMHNENKRQISLIRYDVNGNIVSQSEVSANDPNENRYIGPMLRDMMLISNTLDLRFGLNRIYPSYMAMEYKNDKYTIAPQMQVKGIEVFKILALPDKCFLLIGQGEKGVARLTKITPEGSIVWEKQYDLNQVEYLCDGVVGADSSLFIVGGSVEFKDGPVPETSKIWLLHLDSEGNIINEKLIAGDGFVLTSPKICGLTNHNIIICYDRQPALRKAEIVVRNLTDTFEDKWVKDISSVSVVETSRFYMAKYSGAKEGAVVLLSRRGEFELCQIDADGNIVGDYVKQYGSIEVESIDCSGSKVFISAIDLSNRNKCYLYALQLKCGELKGSDTLFGKNKD